MERSRVLAFGLAFVSRRLVRHGDGLGGSPRTPIILARVNGGRKT
jgi:hypothetical protein